MRNMRKICGIKIKNTRTAEASSFPQANKAQFIMNRLRTGGHSQTIE